jgi:hypothetical protein
VEQTARYFPLCALVVGLCHAAALICRRKLRRALGRTGRVWARVDLRDDCLRFISDWGPEWQGGRHRAC